MPDFSHCVSGEVGVIGTAVHPSDLLWLLPSLQRQETAAGHWLLTESKPYMHRRRGASLLRLLNIWQSRAAAPVCTR